MYLLILKQSFGLCPYNLLTAANWNVIRAGKPWLSSRSLKHSFEVRAQNACYSPEAHMHTRHYRQGVKEREEDC